MGWVGGVSAKEKMWKMRVTDLSVWGAVCGAVSLHPAQPLGPCVMLDGPQFPRGCSTATVPVR